MKMFGRSDLHSLVSTTKTYSPEFVDAPVIWNAERRVPVFDIDEKDVKPLTGFGLSPQLQGVPFTPDELIAKQRYQENSAIEAAAQSGAVAKILAELLASPK